MNQQLLTNHNALDQVSDVVNEPAHIRGAEDTRCLAVGFEIPIDEAHCGHTVLPAFQVIPIRVHKFGTRGPGDQDLGVGDPGYTSSLSKTLTTYPGIVVETFKTRFGNPNSIEQDWGLVEFTALRGVDKWDSTKLFEAGLTEVDLAQDDNNYQPWVVFLLKIQNILFPESLGIFSNEGTEQKDMVRRVKEYVKAVEKNESFSPVIRQCATHAYEMVSGYARWIERHLRKIAEEAVDGNGRKGISGPEIPWRRHINQDLPGSLAIGGLLPGDPEYNQGNRGAFTEEDRELIRMLVQGKAKEAISFDESVQRAIQAAVDAKVAEALAKFEVVPEQVPGTANHLFTQEK